MHSGESPCRFICRYLCMEGRCCLLKADGSFGYSKIKGGKMYLLWKNLQKVEFIFYYQFILQNKKKKSYDLKYSTRYFTCRDMNDQKSNKLTLKIRCLFSELIYLTSGHVLQLNARGKINRRRFVCATASYNIVSFLFRYNHELLMYCIFIVIVTWFNTF